MKTVKLAFKALGPLSVLFGIASAELVAQTPPAPPAPIRLVGEQPRTRRPCAVQVLEHGFRHNLPPEVTPPETAPEPILENFFMTLSPEYGHGNDRPAPITVTFPLAPVPGLPPLSLIGTRGQDILAASFRAPTVAADGTPEPVGVTQFVLFNLRWQHGNHPHFLTCNNLALVVPPSNQRR